jgi:hypothetical protein
MMLRDVSVGKGNADGDGTVGYTVEETVIAGREGLIG